MVHRNGTRLEGQEAGLTLNETTWKRGWWCLSNGGGSEARQAIVSNFAKAIYLHKLCRSHWSHYGFATASRFHPEMS